jgi:hypothetical protein
MYSSNMMRSSPQACVSRRADRGSSPDDATLEAVRGAGARECGVDGSGDVMSAASGSGGDDDVERAADESVNSGGDGTPSETVVKCDITEGGRAVGTPYNGMSGGGDKRRTTLVRDTPSRAPERRRVVIGGKI